MKYAGGVHPRWFCGHLVHDRVLYTRLLQAGQARVFSLLRSKQQELHLVRSLVLACDPLAKARVYKLALALMEHETLDMEEVVKVIQGEPIRNITEVVGEDLSHLRVPNPEPPSPVAASS